MRVECTCRHCGDAFTVESAVIKFGRGLYCSPACQHASKRRRVMCVCRHCGDQFWQHPSTIAHGAGLHCSRACAGMSRRIPPTDGFWLKVDKDGPIPLHVPDLGPCWVWQGTRTKPGYGEFVRLRKKYLAHRFAWSLSNGPIPRGGVICHRCDNPPCVRPSHLFAGTQADNVADKIAKGRGAAGRGMAKANAKLTDDLVREIREVYAAGMPLWTVARHFEVSPSTVYGVVTGRSWRHVE